MTREAQNHDQHQASMDAGREAPDSHRGSTDRSDDKRGVSPTSACHRAVLRMGETRPEGCPGSPAQQASRTRKGRSDDSAGVGTPALPSRRCGTECRESAAKKGALAVAKRRHTVREKTAILSEIERARACTGQPLEGILNHLGLPPSTYYRWLERAQSDTLADRIVVPRRRALAPTPDEVTDVRQLALRHPKMGYKRLPWMMVDRDISCLRRARSAVFWTTTSGYFGGQSLRRSWSSGGRCHTADELFTLGLKAPSADTLGGTRDAVPCSG